MAALALVGIVIMSCSENDFAGNSPKGKPVTLTTTISLDGSGTRALDADGKKTFAKGEQIALIYQSEKDGAQKAVATLEETDIFNEGKSATLTFSLEKAPKKEGEFAMIYPASMAKESLPEGEFSSTTLIANTALDTQDGTLTSLSTKNDLAACDSKFTTDATLPGNITLTNQLVIAEFTIKNFAGTENITDKITNLVIKYGGHTYTVNREAAAGPIYVAMWYCGPNYDVSITANDGLYQKEVKGVTLNAGSMYPVNLKMHKIVDLSKQTSDYKSENGDILTGELGANVKISIAAGDTITLKDAIIIPDGSSSSSRHAGITCLGNATIILEGEGTNKVQAFGDYYPGIKVAHNTGTGDEYTLTIKGNGKLEAKGGNHGTGIGDGDKIEGSSYCGNIIIESGSIIATGGDLAAGIGSGYGGNCGNITIIDGTITATGGTDGAGIGSGEGNDASNPAICGDITILGGKIEATGDVGAGIGSSFYGKCGNITINGGIITQAKGGSGSAGIGCGHSGECGNIIISKGTITKALGGGSAAGIGSSEFGKCGAITIEGGTIENATGGNYGAGIGGGQYGAWGDITISGDAIITLAKGGDRGAGIGSGDSCNEDGKYGKITIEGGTIENATGGNYGAGIGSSHNSKCGDIKIEGGTITKAYGGEQAAGIGTGYSGNCGEIKISGGTITKAKGGDYLDSNVCGGAGIGTGENGICSGGIIISGGTIKEAEGGACSAGIGSGGHNSSSSSLANCGDITISGGTIEKAIGDQGSAGIGTGSKSKCGDIVISGGKIELAQGNDWGVGIGSGSYATCGDITIGKDIIQVTFSSSAEGGNIGKANGTCGTVKFDNVTVTSIPTSTSVYGGLTLTCTNYKIWTLTPTSN